MTKKELSQLYYLKKEINRLQKRLSESEALASNCTIQLTGLPNSKAVRDNVGKYSEQIADLKSLLDLNLKKCFYELNRLERYIQSVDNSEMRQILYLRYIHCLSWQAIAFDMKYQDESVPRKKHNRFLRAIKVK